MNVKSLLDLPYLSDLNVGHKDKKILGVVYLASENNQKCPVQKVILPSLK